MKKVVDEDGRAETEISPDEARAARKGRPVLYMLIGGLVIAAAALALAFGLVG